MAEHPAMRRLSRVTVPALFACLVGLASVVRLAFPLTEPWASVVIALFWLVMLALLIKLARELLFGRRSWEYAFLFIALVAFTVTPILGIKSVAPVTFPIFVASMGGLLVAGYIRLRRSHAPRRPATKLMKS